MERYTKVEYTPLKYRNGTKSISVQKEEIIKSIGINKYKYLGPIRDLSPNSNTIILKNDINYNTNDLKNKYLNYQYNNTELPINSNYSTNINNNNLNNNIYNANNSLNIQLNKTTPYYYSTKLKDKILHNLRDNFQEDKLKKKKALYVNVNFNVNQNYSIPNDASRNTRSLSVQNNTIDINKKNFEGNYNNINNNYISSIDDPNRNKSLKLVYNNEKQMLNMNKNYIYNNQNKKASFSNKRNQNYIKIFNYKSLEFPKNEPLNINNKNNIKQINKGTNINKINRPNKNQQIYNYIKNIHVTTEPNNIQNKTNNNEAQVNFYLYNLELKMKKLLGENKTESKGKNYNIIRKIFEESLNIINLSQIEKNFLKLMMVKYHSVVYAFSQENKALKQTNENLQNLNFSLDKKYIDLDKKYKLLLKENEDIKKSLSIGKLEDKNIINENEKINNDKTNKNGVNEINNMYKSIKDMDFIINDNTQKEENKKEQIDKKDNNNNDLKNNNDQKINIIKKEFKEKEKSKFKEINNNIIKSDNFRKKIDTFNKLNMRLNSNDLDSLYFNDKINNINCQNSQKNYSKVPKIKFRKK